MNKQDQMRKDTLIKTLCKAKEQAETILLYLTANNRDMDDIFAAKETLGHIEISLDRWRMIVRKNVSKRTAEKLVRECPVGRHRWIDPS